jgi:hypothetical protein
VAFRIACITNQPAALGGLVQRRDYAAEGMLIGHDARLLWNTAVEMRTQDQAQAICREVSPHPVYLTVVRRKATCRACGRNMPKGTEAVGFWGDWGHRFTTFSFVHPEPCATFSGGQGR